jgi:predicted tellurium resistance membrane protein TerC
MTINIMAILVICVIAGLCYWVNQQLNTTPVLNKVVAVIIVVVAVLLILQSMGLIGTNTTVRLN